MKSLATIILCLFLFTAYGQIAKTTETGTNSDSEVYEAKMILKSRQM